MRFMRWVGNIGGICRAEAYINPEISERRWRKELKRRQVKQLRRREASARVGTSANKYKSKILDLFISQENPLKRVKNRPRTFVAPRVFSISRNPTGCFKFFADLVHYVRSSRRPRPTLDQREISYLGLGADSVLGVLLSEIKLELQKTYGAYIRGLKPKSKEIQRIMEEVGSVRALFMEAEEDIRISFTSNANVFRHRHREVFDANSSPNFDPTSAAISDFADHLDGSLSIAGKQLSVDGRDRLCHYAAEVLDNVREHSGMHEWAVVGYSDPDVQAPIYRCVIFCFGKTFSDTFSQLPEGSYPLNVIEPYLSAHRRGSLFSEEWRESDLITLIALQGDVSSKSIDGSSDRGQGTVELIQFFQDVMLGNDLRSVKSEMNVISGSTRIRFDGRYNMAFRPDLNRDIIAFNSANNLTEKPDPTAVMSLADVSFPGTLITVEMPLIGAFVEDLRDPLCESN